MSEEERYYLGSEAEIDLANSNNWRVVANDLENMRPGQYCFICGASEEMDPNGKVIGRYREELVNALGDRREDYEVLITNEEDEFGEWSRLKVIRTI